MLEKYIMTQLNENDLLLEKLNRKLLYLQMEENSCRDMMKQLLENEDVGLELFSPRNSEDTTQEKLRRIKKQITGIQLEQTEISEKISRAKENEANYQNMLLEIRRNNETSKKKLQDPGVNGEIGAEERQQYNKKKQSDNDFDQKNESMQRKSEISADDSKRKEELKNILSRVEKCFNLLYSDKSQCKHELINLKYYLKALISEK
ncbi:MAG: hypothetical protein Q4E91_03390 [Lachnospiraceae bacterium]|nr:hypothetical protein [Lachnospiraceae bacterium]